MYIYSMRTAAYLMFRGFVLQGMERSRDSSRNVFVFNDSEDLKKAMEDYKNDKDKLTNFLKR